MWITVDPYRFYYETAGCPQHPALLFLHGFMGDRQEFQDAIALLSHQFYCIAVELPGHGQTEVKAPPAAADSDCTSDYTSNYISDYTMTPTAIGLIRCLDGLGIAACAGLIGYSMGGRLALYLGLHFPARFDRIILESASPGLKTAEAQQQRRQHDDKLAQDLEANFPTFLDRWYQQPLFASTQAHPHFAQLRSRRLQNSPTQLAQSLRHLSTGNQPSLWSNLQYNTVPILLLVGEFDQKFRSINTEMAQVCPQAKLAIVQGCGHNIHFENPQQFVQQVQQFLAASPDIAFPA